jgi:sugar lactone lactonase YvrE
LQKLSIPGIPDGMTIDSDGNLWVAVFGGSRVLKVDGSKSETLLDTIDIPAEQVIALDCSVKKVLQYLSGYFCSVWGQEFRRVVRHDRSHAVAR